MTTQNALNYPIISKDEAIRIIQSQKGKFFTAQFLKRSNGKVRKLNGRLGVKKHVKGIGAVYNAESKGLITVFDAQKRQYRMIPVETMFRLRARKVDYVVV